LGLAGCWRLLSSECERGANERERSERCQRSNALLPPLLNIDDSLTPSIIPLYYLIRRPTYILDFSLTLTFLHLLFTTYFAKSFPTSFFYWVVQALGAVLMVAVAEQVSAASS